MSWACIGRNPKDALPDTFSFHWLERAVEAEKKLAPGDAEWKASADLSRYTGHCYFQSSFQSENADEFRRRMKLAEGAFQRGVEALVKQDDPESKAARARLTGLRDYCEANIANQEDVALDYLHRTFESFSMACEILSDHGWNQLEVLPLELILVSNDLSNYEADKEKSLATLQTALRYAPRVDELPTQADDALRPHLIIETSALQRYAWTHLPTFEERVAAGSKALQLFERFKKEISLEKDPYATVAACALKSFSLYLIPESPPLVALESFLPRVEATRDKVLLGAFLASDLRTKLDLLAESEDPEKARQLLSVCRREADRAISSLQTFGGIRRFNTSAGYLYWTLGDLHIVFGRLFAGSSKERRSQVAEAVDVSRKIRSFSPPLGVAPQHSNLGFYVFEQALLEEDLEKKRAVLEDAYQLGLKYEDGTRHFAPHWEYGDAEHFAVYGRIKLELARISPGNRKGALTEAVRMFEKTAEGVERVVNTPFSVAPATKHQFLARTYFELGTAEIELYRESPDRPILERALAHLDKSAFEAGNQGIPTRAAEALARVGEVYVLAGRSEPARHAFMKAAERYDEAAEHYQGLTVIFKIRAQLMRSRAESAEARTAWTRSAYEQAAQHNIRASELLQGITSMRGLAAYYKAWAQVAESESLSGTNTAQATTLLEAAIKAFGEAEATMSEETTGGILMEEQATSLRNYLAHGKQYAESRLLLERAQSLERNGELAESIERLSEAADRLDALAKEAAARRMETRETIMSHARLCRASKVMLEAEQTLNPELYHDAASIFLEAQRSAKLKSLASLAGGWAAACKALELGLRFRQSGDRELFEAAKKQIALGRSFFLEAGSPAPADWIAATGRMYDALALLGEAEAKLKPEERRNLYELTEKQLRASAELFEKAGYPSLQADAVRHLRVALMEKEATGQHFGPVAPVIQSVSQMTAQNLSQELQAGEELLNAPQLQAALTAPGEQLNVGRDADISITIMNTGQNLLLLLRIENLSHPALEIKTASSEYIVKDGCIETTGKRIQPLSALQVPIRVICARPGSHLLAPKVVYSTTRGETRSLAIPPLDLEVKEFGLKGWLRGSGR